LSATVRNRPSKTKRQGHHSVPSNPRCQPGIIGPHRPGADRDGGKQPAPAVAVGARRCPRDPAGIAGACRDLAVERDAGLGREQRPSCGDPVIEDQVEVGAVIGEHPGDDLDAGGAQQLEALAGVRRVRIRRPDDDAGEAGNGDGLAARRRATVRAAGLERHIKRGPLRRFPAERLRALTSACGSPALAWKALGHHHTVLNDQGADQRVRVRVTPAPAGNLQGAPHEGFVQRLAHRAIAAT
jgi:hypothetical protein